MTHAALDDGACAALSALGDAVALVDRAGGRLDWVSVGWAQRFADWPVGTAVGSIEPALTELLKALDTEGAPQVLAGAHAHEAQLVRWGPDHALLRLADRREQGRILQRQLDDREQLLFTSRAISVSEMAATLAHELNQPIGACTNLLRGLRTRLGRRRVALTGDESIALDRAIEQAMFGARIIARIREFTHSHQPRHVKVDLVAQLRTCASLLDWDLRRSGVRLVVHSPDHAVAVRGDPVMLQQLVVNLMRNALDAMRAAPGHEACLTLRLIENETEVELQVQDTGCGLSGDAEARLFVPFASSKPTGMGIGLSICRSFVELHQGRLWFSRNAGRGVTFHVGLPPWAAAARTTRTAPEEVVCP